MIKENLFSTEFWNGAIALFSFEIITILSYSIFLDIKNTAKKRKTRRNPHTDRKSKWG